jgi:CubicO group peptidase (beta-lactamase class C family)
LLADTEAVPSTRRDITTIPDTPSGKSLKGWLQALGSGKTEVLQAFLEANYDAQQLKRRSARDRALIQMEFLAGFGQRQPLKLINSTPWETTVLGEAAVLEDWTKVTLRVSPEAPHQIVAVINEPVAPPKDIVQSVQPEEVVPRLQRYARKMADSDRFSGVVLLARKNDVLFSQAYGQADKSKRLPNQMETRFGLASMGKMFTAVAIAQLVEAGKFSYNDSLAHVLPDYPNREVAAKVTIHHLLSHTAGLGDFFDKPGISDPGVKRERPRDHFRFFANDPLKFEPGTSWEYSNAGYMVLGEVIERVSGQEYHAYVQQHIFQRAGMTRTGYALGSTSAPQLAVGYTKMDGDEWKPGPSDGGGSAAGGGYSTATDLLRFARALLDHRLLNEQSVQAITTSKAKANFAPNAAYGYGFMIQNANGTTSFGHGGGFPGVCTEMNIYPKEGVVFIVLSNYDPPTANKIAQRMQEMMPAVVRLVAQP